MSRFHAQLLKLGFLSLTSVRELASVLDVPYSRVIWAIYKTPTAQRYDSFDIPKRMGGKHRILAPFPALKFIQRKLGQILQMVYEPKPSVHGLGSGRSVVSNARRHLKKRYVLNIDLEEFFPSINYGRVRGMFLAKPYNLDPSVATALAQICCFENQLPQGAPTSPVVSNMICAQLDTQLQRLAKEHKCTYTRYADDLSFSTTLSDFPESLAAKSDGTTVTVGERLKAIIEQNG